MDKPVHAVQYEEAQRPGIHNELVSSRASGRVSREDLLKWLDGVWAAVAFDRPL
jgi:hypothetical protein